MDLWCHSSDWHWLFFLFSFSVKRGKKMLLSASLSQPFLSLLAQRDVWTDSTSGRPPPPSSFFYGIVTLWVSSPLYLQQEQLPLVTEMVSKKKKTLWNSLQNLLGMGQLWQKSESPVNLPHSVQPKAAERQHSSSGNSRTRPAASDVRELANTRRRSQHHNRFRSTIALFMITPGPNRNWH